MKYLILSGFLFGALSLSAQARTVNNTTFEDASMTAYELVINASPEKVLDVWEDYWKDRYDVDLDREDRNREREVYNAKQTMVAAVSDKQMDVYTKVSKGQEDRATVSLGLGFGYDVYAGNDQFNQEFKAGEQIMNDFEQYFYDTYYGEKIENISEQLDDARDEREDLKEDISKDDRRIERWMKKIAQYEASIAETKDETKETREAIATQEAKVNELEAELREMEKMSTQWKRNR